MSIPCHEGPPATKGHFSSEPAVAGRGRYYCMTARPSVCNMQCRVTLSYFSLHQSVYTSRVGRMGGMHKAVRKWNTETRKVLRHG